MHSASKFTLITLTSAALIATVTTPAYAAVGTTELIANIGAGAVGGDPYEITEFNGLLYFGADDGAGYELFVSDGSVGSATNLNLNPSGGSDPYNLTVIGNSLYFGAYDDVHGNELWSITGAGAPTRLTDLEPGVGSSDPTDLIAFDGDIYFRAFTNVTGQSMFRLSGGVAAQYPMGGVQSPDEFYVYNGFMYLGAFGGGDYELYRIDGTNPPVPFFESNPAGFGFPHNLVEAGGWLYFISNDGAHGPYNYELYATDGTTTNKLTTDLEDDNGYQYYEVFNDTLYFSAGNAAIGRELGHSTAGAVPTFFDINPGANPSSPEGFTAYNGSLYFGADNGVNGFELYSLTGAAAPVLRADLLPGAGSGYPYDFEVVGSRLAFAATGTGSEWELWSFDGTAANQETALYPTGDADVYYLTELNGYVYFAGNSAATGFELWRTRLAGAATASLAATGTEPVLPLGAAGGLLALGALALLFQRRATPRAAAIRLS